MPDAKGRIRYAVVGLGWFAQAAILPAFRNAKKNSVLAALVSGDDEKREELSREYKVHSYSYDQYHELIRSGAVDAVYIATPNRLHHDYTVRAAAARVHVLCEKPMADTVAAAKEMLDACRQNNVKLMIAYRLHFEEANLKAIEIANGGKIGAPRVFQSFNTQQVREGNVTRLEAELGAGPVRDMGIYCINAARYLFRDEPIEVTAFLARSADPRFREVPEMVSALMRFPEERLAAFTAGFGEAKVSEYRLIGTKGDLRLEPAYSFDADLFHYLTVDAQTEKTKFRRRDQVGPEILYFSDCILQNREPEPDGLEGLIDMQIIDAILESAAHNGRPLQLPKLEKRRRPSEEQDIERPPVTEPDLVKAEPAAK
jgi:predicted dehydrogenase